MLILINVNNVNNVNMNDNTNIYTQQTTVQQRVEARANIRHVFHRSDSQSIHCNAMKMRPRIVVYERMRLFLHSFFFRNVKFNFYFM